MTRPAGGGAAPRIVVIGAGFGGLEVARALGRADIGVTIIDRHNHHLFQPLLYQVATAALSAPDIAEPIRKILGRYRSVQVLFGTVERIDTGQKLVALADGITISYDLLVLASGAGTSYFGRNGWSDFAPGLKTIADARRIRSRLLLAFEHAERSVDPVEQARLMTVAVVGGGPTGVELAGSIAELSRYTLARDFRNVRPETTRIMLIEASDRLLPGFSAELAEYAQRRLERLGVDVATGRRVDDIGAESISFAGQSVPVGLTIWAAGVAASPLAAQLGVELDRGGRLPVEQDLRVRGTADVFAIGDVAHFDHAGALPLPGLAQVAKQQGAHLGHALAAQISRGTALPEFVYRNRGNTAIVGRHAAVFEQRSLQLKGWIAWMAWAFIHVYLLVGFQHRVLVSIQWLWRYLTYEHGARLIAEEEPSLRHRGNTEHLREPR